MVHFSKNIVISKILLFDKAKSLVFDSFYADTQWYWICTRDDFGCGGWKQCFLFVSGFRDNCVFFLFVNVVMILDLFSGRENLSILQSNRSSYLRNPATEATSTNARAPLSWLSTSIFLRCLMHPFPSFLSLTQEALFDVAFLTTFDFYSSYVLMLQKKLWH